jgi:hypothetical protein
METIPCWVTYLIEYFQILSAGHSARVRFIKYIDASIKK